MNEPLGNEPDASQLLVLHAALDEPEAGLAAWRAWRERIAFDEVDYGSTRLLPLVYRNLGSRAFDAEVAGRLKGLYRRSWSYNQLLFKRATPAIAALEAAGIETLVTKGASLAVLSYGDVGARPMDDVDVLVPLARAAEAIAVLRSAGWSAEHEDPQSWMQVHHSLGFAGSDGGEVDLHWFALWQPARDEALWRASVPLELAGQPTRRPAPPINCCSPASTALPGARCLPFAGSPTPRRSSAPPATGSTGIAWSQKPSAAGSPSPREPPSPTRATSLA